MILNAEFIGSDTIKVYPPQLETDGRILADLVMGRADIELKVESLDEENSRLLSRLEEEENTRTGLEDVLESAIKELDRILYDTARPLKADLKKLLKALQAKETI